MSSLQPSKNISNYKSGKKLCNHESTSVWTKIRQSNEIELPKGSHINP